MVRLVGFAVGIEPGKYLQTSPESVYDGHIAAFLIKTTTTRSLRLPRTTNLCACLDGHGLHGVELLAV